jgi:type VI secretion system secreted protein VgrG
VQYRESDFDFLCRLMEEEGIYYYFSPIGSNEMLVLTDSIGGHDPCTPGTIEFRHDEPGKRGVLDHFYQWSAATLATTGKVTLRDYDFEAPSPVPEGTKELKRGTQKAADLEHYDYQGHFRKAGPGGNVSRVRMEAEAVRHKTWTGSCNVRTLATGQTFKMKDHVRAERDGTEYLVTATTAILQEAEDHVPVRVTDLPPTALDHASAEADICRMVVRAIPKAEQFRAPQVTPWPQIAGIQTALVVGPPGEEIHTDAYGRVRVQFHWDRVGQKDDKSSVWVRTMQPWTGKGWGMIAVPRVGQEVVVQFEDGNPDRPLVVGMLYNKDTMPPYALPGNMTQSGVKTRSTKEAAETNFNELVFEDKKGAEFVRLQSERDYFEKIKNNATITVGVDTKDKGDMSLTVHRNLSETLKTGNHSFRVETGNQDIFIKTDKTEKIEGKSDLTVKGDVTETVEEGNVTRTVKAGNVTETVEKGNVTREVNKGNVTEKVTAGNVKIDVTAGSVAITAGQQITLTVGGSSIKIDNSGVTIKGLGIVKVESDGAVNVKAGVTMVKGDAALVLSGGVTKIN